MLPFLPIVLVGLTGAAYYAKTKRVEKGVVTPQRQAVFEQALNEKDPDKLEKIANTFRSAGLNPHADLLDKRAKLRRLPDEVKKGRQAALRKAMSSENVNGIRQLANAFDKEGATGAANSLRDHASALVAKQNVTPPPQAEPPHGEAEEESEIVETQENIEPEKPAESEETPQ